jgi:hypothetical protein
MLTTRDLLSLEEEEKFRAGRILADEEIALKTIFSRQDKFTAGYDQFMKSFRNLRGAPRRLSPRENNVQALYFSANIWKLPPPARARAGVFFVMPERAPAPTGAGSARIYTYRKNINHDYGSGAYACGQRKTPPQGAIIVKPSPAKNILRSGDAARHCRYILRLPPVPRGPDKNTENMPDDTDIFADDLVFRASRGGCDDPIYWTMKEKHEKAGARHQWRLMVALPNNFCHADFARFAEAFDEKTAAWQLGYVLAVHAKRTVLTGTAPNSHAHILLSDRNAIETPTGYIFDAQKNRALARAGMVRELRQVCADSINIALGARGAALRVTAESYAARGLHRPQAKHLGSRAHQIELRGGITEVGRHNRALAFDERLSFLPVIQEKIIAKTMRKRGHQASNSLRRVIADDVEVACELAIFNWNMAELLKQYRHVLRQQQQQDPSAIAAAGLLENYVLKRRSSMVVVCRVRSQTLAQAVAAQKMREQAQAERKQKILEKLSQKPLLTQNLSQQALTSPKPVASPFNRPPTISAITATATGAKVIQQQPSLAELPRTTTPIHSHQGNDANTPQLQAALFHLYLINRAWQAQNSKIDESAFDAARKAQTEKRAALWQQHDKAHLRTLQALPVGSHPRIVAALTGPIIQRPRSFLELDQLLKQCIKPTETAFLCRLFDYLNTSLLHWQRIEKDHKAQVLTEQLRKEQQESWTKKREEQHEASHKLIKDAINQLHEGWSSALEKTLDQQLPDISTTIIKCFDSINITSKRTTAIIDALKKCPQATQILEAAKKSMLPLMNEASTGSIIDLARSVTIQTQLIEDEKQKLASTYEARIKIILTAQANPHQRDAAPMSLTIDSQGALLEAMRLLSIGSDPHFGRPTVFDSLNWFSRSIPAPVVDSALHSEAKKLYLYLDDVDTVWRNAHFPDAQAWRHSLTNELKDEIASIEQLLPQQQAKTWISWQAIKPMSDGELSIRHLLEIGEKNATPTTIFDSKSNREHQTAATQILKDARDAAINLQNIFEKKARAKAVDAYINRTNHDWYKLHLKMTDSWSRKSEQEFDRALDKAQKCAARVKDLSQKTNYGRSWFAEDGEHVITQICEIKSVIDWKYRDWSEATCKATTRAATQTQVPQASVARPASNSSSHEKAERYIPWAERQR